jgi:signal transduction histidine kinase
VLKNAVRATVERHALSGPRRLSPRLPPVAVRVCAGAPNGGGAGAALTVRISDQGGGIPEDILSKVWAYGFTTSDLCPIGPSGGVESNGGSGGGGGSNGGGGGGDGSGGEGGEGGEGGMGIGVNLAAASEAPRQRYKLAGLGFGLPLSRLYARYWGGDLTIQNMPGFGVDAYLTLKNLADPAHDWRERDHAL